MDDRAGVVDQHVQPGRELEDLRGQLAHLFLRGEVGHRREHGRTGRARRRARRRPPPPPVRAAPVDDHGGAASRQLDRRLAADAGGGARDQDDLADHYILLRCRRRRVPTGRAAAEPAPRRCPVTGGGAGLWLTRRPAITSRAVWWRRARSRHFETLTFTVPRENGPTFSVTLPVAFVVPTLVPILTLTPATAAPASFTVTTSEYLVPALSVGLENVTSSPASSCVCQVAAPDALSMCASTSTLAAWASQRGARRC